MQLSIKTNANQDAGAVEVSEAAFGREYNGPLIHQVVVAYLAGERQGTKKQKNRSERQGGGAKPWRQKGTGRARAGSIRSPIWRKGGVTFAATPRDHEQKVNKKMYRGAMQSIVSELIRQERLIVVEDMKMDQPKTKALIERLNVFGLKDVLIVTDEMDENLCLSARNIPKVHVTPVEGISPVRLLNFENTLVTKGALKKIEEILK